MPAAGPTYTIRGLNAVLRTLPKEASNGLRDAAQAIANDAAAAARSRAEGVSKTYAKWVAPTIKARRDRVPVLYAGGNKRLPPHLRLTDRRVAGASYPRYTVGHLLYGVEFGGQGRPTTMQFLPHKGTVGYAIFPALRALHPDIGDRYSLALHDVLVNL